MPAVARPERATVLQRLATAVLRYGFVNLGRAPVAPRNGLAVLRCGVNVYRTGTDVIP